MFVPITFANKKKTRSQNKKSKLSTTTKNSCEAIPIVIVRKSSTPGGQMCSIAPLSKHAKSASKCSDSTRSKCTNFAEWPFLEGNDIAGLVKEAFEVVMMELYMLLVLREHQRVFVLRDN